MSPDVSQMFDVVKYLPRGNIIVSGVRVCNCLPPRRYLLRGGLAEQQDGLGGGLRCFTLRKMPHVVERLTFLADLDVCLSALGEAPAVA